MIDLEKIQDFNYEGQRLLFENSKRLDQEGIKYTESNEKKE